VQLIHIRIARGITTMKFNLKEKLQQARDVGTTALSVAVISFDNAAGRAIEKLTDLQEAAGRKTGEIRTVVSEKVDHTREVIKGKTDVVKEKAVTNLGKLGDAIEENAGKVSSVAAEFGKNARNRLNLRKPAPVEAAPAVAEAAPAVAKKTRKRAAKKPAGKKPSR
jgi:hypothetical protein